MGGRVAGAVKLLRRTEVKALSDKTLDTLEDVAMEGAKHLKAFFTYQGANANYLTKAKLGATAIAGYARIRASETNRMSVELAYQKATGKKTQAA
jgi:hypothetical protein